MRRRSILLLCVLCVFGGMTLAGGLSGALTKKPSPYHKLNLFTRVLSSVDPTRSVNITVAVPTFESLIIPPGVGTLLGPLSLP